ncbi:MAG: hypothetical protein AMXMBFR84_29350 [Candidatus Hydrogenedentota bacterium]
MAIKGQGYVKTTWAFEERPVASSKLNTWDDRIEAALELAFHLLNHAWGGDSGVLRNATADDLRVHATTPESVRVRVEPGYAFISKCPFRMTGPAETGDLAPPAAQPRIDLVQARLDTWSVQVLTGVESATPSPPVAGTDCIALAQIYLRPGMTTIKDADDSVNGYITDVRTFL